MKIEFKDGSFLEAIEDSENKKVNIIMCGIKDYNKFTMSASSINKEQIEKLIEFLSEAVHNI